MLQHGMSPEKSGNLVHDLVDPCGKPTDAGLLDRHDGGRKVLLIEKACFTRETPAACEKPVETS